MTIGRGKHQQQKVNFNLAKKPVWMKSIKHALLRRCKVDLKGPEAAQLKVHAKICKLKIGQ